VTQAAPTVARDGVTGGEALLTVRGLKTHFHTLDGTVKAVDGVDFSLPPGGTLGIVGESGSGKSVTAYSLLRLIDIPPGEIVDGEAIFEGRDLLRIPMSEMQKIRGSEIAMIFQEPMTSLNPVFTIGNQIAEAVKLHQDVNDKEAWNRAIEALRDVGIAAPERRVKQYPYELSGGMRQRAMIAMALSCKPKLLIADEPTTALDVTIQAQILELIKDIQERTQTALLLITHDLAVVAETCQQVVVMYAGRVVESGSVEEVLLRPKHPYTQGLLDSIPSEKKRGEKLSAIKGVVPNPFRLPPGCKFKPRCAYAWDRCDEEPGLLSAGGDRVARCWLQAPEERERRATFQAAAEATVRAVVDVGVEPA